MKKAMLALYFSVFIAAANAQQFEASELIPVMPMQLIIDQYTRVSLSEKVIDDPGANRFDVNNPYSYIQVVKDAKGKTYHVVYQTNFYGKLLFLAYSNNLSALFNKKEKPFFLFQLCLKEVNEQPSMMQVADKLVKCMLDRLNYCSGFN